MSVSLKGTSLIPSLLTWETEDRKIGLGGVLQEILDSCSRPLELMGRERKGTDTVSWVTGTWGQAYRLPPRACREARCIGRQSSPGPATGSFLPSLRWPRCWNQVGPLLLPVWGDTCWPSMELAAAVTFLPTYQLVCILIQFLSDSFSQ